MVILDRGMGIFRKIQQALNLFNERYAILELAKGKFTTDPNHRAGKECFSPLVVFEFIQYLIGKLLLISCNIKLALGKTGSLKPQVEQEALHWMKLR